MIGHDLLAGDKGAIIVVALTGENRASRRKLARKGYRDPVAREIDRKILTLVE